MLRRRVVSEAQ
jgi:hypothetical protein